MLENLFARSLSLSGLSQSEAAEQLGCNLSSVKHWCAGRRDVPAGIYTSLAVLCAKIQKIADARAEEIYHNGIGWPTEITRIADLPAGSQEMVETMAIMMLASDDMGFAEQI
ncbi:helix-turn-helix domain-containing protein [Ruegeria arenilitoris]|uniref:helix-turn-helix domain-containing protein n=1 Tax=Ruegeria arenilitoris TaxID=1173585 RepID=UPI00147A4A97|nr:helix-turn-helix domain-containing protein [Ruegeria arenilitoris]